MQDAWCIMYYTILILYLDAFGAQERLHPASDLIGVRAPAVYGTAIQLVQQYSWYSSTAGTAYTKARPRRVGCTVMYIQQVQQKH